MFFLQYLISRSFRLKVIPFAISCERRKTPRAFAAFSDDNEQTNSHPVIKSLYVQSKGKNNGGNPLKLNLSKDKLSVGTVNSNKILTIYNRATLYGYFIEQMEEYYNLTGIEELDKNYVKMIPKRKMKENLCFVENMNRATEVLIQSSTNKQQRNIIKQYLCKYKLYKQEMRNIKIRKMQQKNNNSKNKSVRTMSDHIPNNGGKNNNPEKKLSVDLQIMRDNGSGQTYGFSIELQPNMSSSLLNLAKQNQEYSNLKQSIMKKIRHSEGSNENMYNFDKGSNKNKIKFPTLSRSMDKKQKIKQQYPEKAKLYRFPTNEDQTLVQKQQESKSSLFKFSQRQTIKGIIIKNFLSSRQKQKMTKLKQSQMQQLYIKNKQQQNTKRNGSKMQLQRKVIESVDLRSLRQKTKALLKNFRTIQNY